MNLLRTLATVSSLTMVSRLLGYARDFFIARAFGAGLATDAFFVAFKIPNLLRRLFAEGAFSQAFVPILAEYRNRTTAEDARSLIDAVSTLLLVALVLAAAIGMVAAPLIIYVTAPGWHDDPDKFALAVSMLRITFPYIVFISLVSLAAGILNTWSRFSVPAITPALLNVSFIVGTVAFAGYFDPPIRVLAWAVFVGGALQLAFQIPFLVKLGLLPRWRIDLRSPGVRRILLLMAPAAFGVSVSQVSQLLNQVFASFLQTGSISWLYYADRLMELPNGLLGVAVGTILLPSLSKYHATRNSLEYNRMLDWGVRVTVLLAVPSAVALAVLALPLITMLFQYGAFTAQDAWMTRQALIAYSFGLVGMVLVKILAPAFFATQNVATPVKYGLAALIATQLMNLALVAPLRHAGLALALAAGACLNAGLLYFGLRKRAIYTPLPGWPLFILKVVGAVAVMAIVLFTAMGEPAWWLGASWQRKVPAVVGLVLLGAVAYGGCLFVFGLRPRDFSRRAAE
jgi:putative peptidoglycan lipid II flippase